MNEVDHFIKEKLHIKFYGRYMDDLYLLHDDPHYLNYCLEEIEKKLREVGLEMNGKKSYISIIHPIGEDGKKKAPFKYLKWNFYLTNTNRIIQVPFKEKIAK
ncbi:MAG: reverse transcriptase domain-containing protein [Acetobacter sp.]|nr:reverse transcriptase domain-containing protein [Acetobacter sp.]